MAKFKKKWSPKTEDLAPTILTDASPVLAHLVYNAFVKALFQNFFKTSALVPNRKKGSRGDVMNYRPVEYFLV